MEKNITVCVTGSSSLFGSCLVKELLHRGYTVHATLRNLGEQTKVGLLKGLPHADTRLKLFQADIYNADEFAAAIQGCQIVIHMATPWQHNPESSKYQNTSDAAVAGVRSIIESCIETKTVKRLIYTASMTAASPLKDDGSGFKDIINESCWTPYNISVPYANNSITEYTQSKTLAEKEALSYQGKNIEVVTLALGLVGGDTLQSEVSSSMEILLSQAKNDQTKYSTLRYLQELLGKIPILHSEDVTAAHIFCMDDSVPSGRYLCANGYLKTAEIAAHFQRYHPDIKIAKEFIEDSVREIRWGSTKLEDLGFLYKHDVKMTLDDSVQCAKRLGHLV